MKFSISDEDLEFKNRFESCEYLAGEFDHKAHLRLAYIYLAEYDVATATRLMRDSLKRFIAHNGVEPQKYHETLTSAWMLAVHYFMNKTGNCNSSEALISNNPAMLDAKIMMTHYTEALLFSDAARNRFLQPDLDPIPRYR